MPIDVVFTWVDGAEPDWRAAFDEWSALDPTVTGPDARSPARYRDNDELRHAMRAVWRYAPWVRVIHVVTCGHRPRWLRPDDRVRVVAHHELFDPQDVPTFNSHAIESRLHHVPDLAEHFVYFNDDVFLARPQVPGRFFTTSGRPRVALSRHPVPTVVTPFSATVDQSAAVGARLIEAATGRPVRHRPQHGPFALRRSHLFELERRFPADLARTAAARFRSPHDVSLATFLAPLHALATGQARVGDLHVDAVNVDDPALPRHLARLGPDTRFDAFCLNDTERVPDGDSAPRRLVTRFLTGRFADPAPWELEPAMPAGSSLRPPAVRRTASLDGDLGPLLGGRVAVLGALGLDDDAPQHALGHGEGRVVAR